MIICVAIIAVAWVGTLFIVRHELPAWATNEVILMRVMMYTQENRIESLEAQASLTKEVRRFRKAMKGFVKSQSCKIYVKGKR